MDAIHLRGGNPLFGETRIQGSKNAALPILAASLLCDGISEIKNCPRIADVEHMKGLLKTLGCKIKRGEHSILIDASNVEKGHIANHEMRGESVTCMRSSIMLLGAMLSRTGEVTLAYPGGCVIGDRPIDLHIKALGRMGVEIYEEEGFFRAYVEKLKGASITLPLPSVGATENVILAAVKANGVTVLQNAAREPEIIALCEYLLAAGAIIEGIGKSTLLIKGVPVLKGITYQIPADRIVAGTYLLTTLANGGHVLLKEAPVRHMKSILQKAVKMGAKLTFSREGLSIITDPVRENIPYLQTEAYPGFPTDLQSPFMAVLTRVQGVSVIEETIFENRFHIVEQLRKMGADIELQGHNRAVITGVGRLNGCEVSASELRGGAALVLAGSMADGETIITNKHFIERGYEDICRDYQNLGVTIYIG